jgi:uncharacterized repeat protein (TIGR03803 family)
MQSKARSFGLTAALPILTALLLILGMPASAQQEKVLHFFSANGTDGYGPSAKLILDASGNVYGVTARGGLHNNGTVFELTNRVGRWRERILHTFDQMPDGTIPNNVVFDTAGNLFGTTAGGGTIGWGALFKLTPQEDGSWAETVLYNFTAEGKSGTVPISSLVFDPSGNLYGTTLFGGTGPCSTSNGIKGCGTVFELIPQADGTWIQKTLHSFGPGTAGPLDVVRDAAGNLYGTTPAQTVCAGPPACGSIFELMPNADGVWTEKIIHNFSASGLDAQPNGDLILDADGNLYGTTAAGGVDSCAGGQGCGTVFELSPGTNGAWTEKILHSFSDRGTDGHFPVGGVILDEAGNLYGTTWVGGTGTCGAGCGVVFELLAPSGGTRAEKVLHNFANSVRDGNLPQAGLALDSFGNLYGTTYYGGFNHGGTVFEVIP